MHRIAVIDTETTWADQVMSIGIVVADATSYKPLDHRYYTISPYKNYGGMYSHALYVDSILPDLEASEQEVMSEIREYLLSHKIERMFAYNAAFDYRHLPSLQYLTWYDIMKLAAYRQFNPEIPCHADCYRTGRLKCGYGVENIYRMLSGNRRYCERHNALTDALEELEIMRMLRHDLEVYEAARIP